MGWEGRRAGALRTLPAGRAIVDAFAELPEAAGGLGVVEEGADALHPVADDVAAEVHEVAAGIRTERHLDEPAAGGVAGRAGRQRTGAQMARHERRSGMVIWPIVPRSWPAGLYTRRAVVRFLRTVSSCWPAARAGAASVSRFGRRAG